MTIAERYAKYTTDELKEGVAILKKQIADNNSRKAAFEAKNDVEFFCMADEYGEMLHSQLYDAECALLGRTSN